MIKSGIEHDIFLRSLPLMC